MAWRSTHKTKLQNIHLKQEHAISFICNKSKFTHTKPLMRSLQVLNVFQINIQKVLVFIHRIKTCSDVPSIFANNFTYPSHRYPTNFSKNNFAIPKYLKVTIQNIIYLLDVLQSETRFCQPLRKISKKPIYLKRNWDIVKLPLMCHF